MEAESFELRELFAPKVIVSSVSGLFTVDLQTGKESKTSVPCLVCDDEISAGYAVTIDNGGNDRIRVGYCCSTHDKQAIAINAFALLATLLRKRADAAQKMVDTLVSDPIEVCVE